MAGLSGFCACCAAKGNPTLMKCARCKMAYYCNRTCQREDWALHQVVCGTMDRHPMLKLSKQWTNEENVEGVNLVAETYMRAAFATVLPPGTFFEVTVSTDPALTKVRIVRDDDGRFNIFGRIPAYAVVDERGEAVTSVMVEDKQEFVPGRNPRIELFKRNRLVDKLSTSLRSFVARTTSPSLELAVERYWNRLDEGVAAVDDATNNPDYIARVREKMEGNLRRIRAEGDADRAVLYENLLSRLQQVGLSPHPSLE